LPPSPASVEASFVAASLLAPPLAGAPAAPELPVALPEPLAPPAEPEGFGAVASGAIPDAPVTWPAGGVFALPQLAARASETAAQRASRTGTASARRIRFDASIGSRLPFVD
jgi:hypothetical protein